MLPQFQRDCSRILEKLLTCDNECLRVLGLAQEHGHACAGALHGRRTETSRSRAVGSGKPDWRAHVWSSIRVLCARGRTVLPQLLVPSSAICCEPDTIRALFGCMKLFPLLKAVGLACMSGLGAGFAIGLAAARSAIARQEPSSLKTPLANPKY